MPFEQGYSVARICEKEQAMHARALQVIKDMFARKEIERKAKIKRTGRVPNAYQIPTWREEITGRIREKHEPYNER
jgi:hypothetical protein|tara:strand:+ start:103 stop:330 length:228 start_codon:yes stop_codon:yes gene_type:complete